MSSTATRATTTKSGGRAKVKGMKVASRSQKADLQFPMGRIAHYLRLSTRRLLREPPVTSLLLRRLRPDDSWLQPPLLHSHRLLAITATNCSLSSLLCSHSRCSTIIVVAHRRLLLVVAAIANRRR
ncbi:hypothetical protein ZIOFF_011445 [Zingiber officinale]|uniref:Uncharacterized protein n=1 Tax=Zingiber officinale TaxID=94328 RepID=A0A8J5M137_ZINOF|nr:hypothetical protein ZIOFF_011445 [Zingiber officinale]